jgi:hypothetical protein
MGDALGAWNRRRESQAQGLGICPYLLDRISGECRRWVDIRASGARDAGRWQVPSKGLKPDFAAALKDLYLLCVSDVEVRRRTAEWIAIMRETRG